MTLNATESRGEKCLHQFPSEGVADHETAQTDQVQIVIFDALVRRKVFVNQAGPNSRHFVRADRRPDTTSANGHATRNLSAGNSAGQWHDKIRIIIFHLWYSVAEINHIMTGRAQHPD